MIAELQRLRVFLVSEGERLQRKLADYDKLISETSSRIAGELAPKRLQLLHQLLPKAALFGVLADPAFPVAESTIADLQAAARMLGLQLFVVNARTEWRSRNGLRNLFAGERPHR